MNTTEFLIKFQQSFNYNGTDKFLLLHFPWVTLLAEHDDKLQGPVVRRVIYSTIYRIAIFSNFIKLFIY